MQDSPAISFFAAYFASVSNVNKSSGDSFTLLISKDNNLILPLNVLYCFPQVKCKHFYPNVNPISLLVPYISPFTKSCGGHILLTVVQATGKTDAKVYKTTYIKSSKVSHTVHVIVPDL